MHQNFKGGGNEGAGRKEGGQGRGGGRKREERQKYIGTSWLSPSRYWNREGLGSGRKDITNCTRITAYVSTNVTNRNVSSTPCKVSKKHTESPVK